MRPPSKAFTIFYLFLGTICYFFIASVTTASAWNVWLDHSVKKYRQDGEDGISGAQSLTVKMAKNEFESFQVFVYADAENLSNVDVTVSNFTKGTDVIDNVYIYKEHYVNCSLTSRPEYETGYYPDALLPKVDRFYNETRTTFPFDVTSGKVQGVWVDVGTETSTAAGTYTATVTISADGKSNVLLPITLEVFDFALPSTSNFPATFIMRADAVTYGHGWEGNIISAEQKELIDQYNKMYLYNRMTSWVTGDGYSMAYNWDSELKTLTITNYEPWESRLRPAIEGTAITTGPMSGARFPINNVPRSYLPDRSDSIADADKETAARQFLQQVYNRFASNGWDPFNKMYANVIDEPNCNNTLTFRGATRNMCEIAYMQAADAQAINTGGAGVFDNIYAHKRNNAPGFTEFEDYGFYAPILNTYSCPAWDKTCSVGGTPTPRDTYKDSPAWAYMGCFMNGCGINDEPAFNGQVDYSVDAVAMYNRLPSFYQYRVRLTGSFFWGVVALNYDNSTYNDMWSSEFASNGDGHLLYAGITSHTGRTWTNHAGSQADAPAIGGTHDIPIASIRWKYIRDGQDDLEYFKLAEEQNDRATVLDVVNTMFLGSDEQAWWNLNMSVNDLFSARENIASLITGGGPIFPSVSLAAPQAVSEDVGTVTVTATLSAVSGLQVTVPYTVGGTATDNGTDHNLAAGNITIPAGQLTGSVTFQITDDGEPEDDETVIVTMTTANLTNATPGAITVHTVTIIDNYHAAADKTFSAGELLVLTGDVSWETAASNATAENWAVVTGPYDVIITGNVDISYVSFQNTGDVRFAAASGNVLVDHCVFTGQERVHVGSNEYAAMGVFGDTTTTPESANLRILNSDFRGQTESPFLVLTGTGDNPSGTFEVSGCTFHPELYTNAAASASDRPGNIYLGSRNKIHFHHNSLWNTIVLAGRPDLDLGSVLSGNHTFEQNLFYIDNSVSHGGGQVIFLRSFEETSNIKNSYWFAAYSNPHLFAGNGNVARPEYRENVFEILYNYDGANIVSAGNQNGDVLMEKNILIGTGSLANNVGNHEYSGTFTVKNNTCYVTSTANNPYPSLWLSEGGVRTGSIHIANNLVSGSVTSNYAIGDILSTLPDQTISYSDYNNFHNITTPYLRAPVTSGLTHDISADPQFVDPDRNLADYYNYKESTSGSLPEDAINQFMRMNGYNSATVTQSDTSSGYDIDELLGYVKEGFRPTNPALQGAGDPLDGSPDIGAMAVATSSIPGDIDQDGDVDLRDAILGLQIATGGTPETISPDGDVDGDGKIGIEEVIYILQSVQDE